MKGTHQTEGVLDKPQLLREIDKDEKERKTVKLILTVPYDRALWAFLGESAGKSLYMLLSQTQLELELE